MTFNEVISKNIGGQFCSFAANRRAVCQQAVKINGVLITDTKFLDTEVKIGDKIQIGKRIELIVSKTS